MVPEILLFLIVWSVYYVQLSHTSVVYLWDYAYLPYMVMLVDKLVRFTHYLFALTIII